MHRPRVVPGTIKREVLDIPDVFVPVPPTRSTWDSGKCHHCRCGSPAPEAAGRGSGPALSPWLRGRWLHPRMILLCTHAPVDLRKPKPGSGRSHVILLSTQPQGWCEERSQGLGQEAQGNPLNLDTRGPAASTVPKLESQAQS